jgi:serine/threonine protein kinase
LGERYQILDCIGIGGFGIVYLCNDRYLRRLAAVKEYFPEEWALREEPYVDVKSSLYLEAFRFGLQSFEKEAKIQSQLLYTPHVAGIYDLFEENDTMYLVMEYISGVSIGREMRAREYRPYSPKEMAEILVPVMEALAVIHEKRIVHSDISPGNIMRAADGEIYLIDMGAAKYTLDSQPALSAAFLKIDYAAPEQYRTAKEGIPKDEGPWTDIYSLGATMYYLLTGQKPVDVVTRLGSKKPGVVLPRKCKCPNRKKWEKLINHACELEIGKRISSVEELSRQVSDLARES